jgi:hypothetical protein
MPNRVRVSCPACETPVELRRGFLAVAVHADEASGPSGGSVIIVDRVVVHRCTGNDPDVSLSSESR